MTGGRTRIVPLALAAVFVLPVIALSSSPSAAEPTTKADVAAAKAGLDQVNQQLEGVVEQYNQARVALEQAQGKLADAKRAKDRAQAAADAARAQLGERAVQAYTGMGSQLDVLLGAEDFTQFSDRLAFMGALAQNDADLATAADAATQKAEWATEQYNGAVTDAQTQLDAVESRRNEILGLLDQAQALYEQTNQDYEQFLAAQRAAAQEQQAQDATGSSGGSPPPTADDGGGGSVPPPNATAAATAIAAAKSVLGAQYVFGTAGPDTFDCSGLTMWAYAQAGIYLPHSSASQYAAFPQVSQDQLQPGDLLFFFSPIHHVAIYLGGSSMIDTVHPGADGVVAIRSVWWDLYVGAVRPS